MHNCILKAQNNIHYWKQISEENISYQSRPIAMHLSHYSKGSSPRIWIVCNHAVNQILDCPILIHRTPMWLTVCVTAHNPNPFTNPSAGIGRNNYSLKKHLKLLYDIERCSVCRLKELNINLTKKLSKIKYVKY